MKKILVWSVAAILVLGLAAGAFWWELRPQVINFSDGSKVTLLAMQYGKRHAPPTVKLPAASTNSAPAPPGRGSFTTTDDTLVLWLRREYDTSGNHGFQYFVYDQAGTACVPCYGINYRAGRRGDDTVAVQLDAFPRRQARFYVRVLEQSNGGNEMSDQKFVIHNPARGTIAQWTPDPLPSAKDDDDVTVTLTRLSASVDMPFQRDQDNADDAANKGVQAVFHVERNGKPVTNWQPVSVITTDATGNEVNGSISGNQWQDNNDTVTYQYGLWPDEPAWKIKFEFSQQSGFADDELWTVPNIPIQPGRRRDFNRPVQTGAAVAETDLSGVHLKILPVKQFTDVPPNTEPQGGLIIQAEPDFPDEMHMTLVSLTDHQTNDIRYRDDGYDYDRNGKAIQHRYALRDISGLTNLNLTLTLHKSRFVEFTAKPAKQ